MRIVKDVMTKKSEQVFDLFAPQHDENESYRSESKKGFFSEFFLPDDQIQKLF